MLFMVRFVDYLQEFTDLHLANSCAVITEETINLFHVTAAVTLHPQKFKAKKLGHNREMFVISLNRHVTAM